MVEAVVLAVTEDFMTDKQQCNILNGKKPSFPFIFKYQKAEEVQVESRSQLWHSALDPAPTSPERKMVVPICPYLGNKTGKNFDLVSTRKTEAKTVFSNFQNGPARKWISSHMPGVAGGDDLMDAFSI